MAKIVAKGVTEPIPKGTYSAKIKKVDIVERVLDTGEKVQYIDLIWLVTKGASKDREVRDGMPFNLSPKSKLGTLFKEITGEEVKEGEEYDTSELIGAEADITLNIEKITGRGTTPLEVNRVMSVIKK
jgi:hypothetical protein